MKKNYTDALKKMEELRVLCAMEGIPFFAVVAEETGTETKYHSEVVTPVQAGIKLTNDKITKYNAALSNDFYIKLVTAEEKAMSAAALYDEVLSAE